jgi:hypothetical protein
MIIQTDVLGGIVALTMLMMMLISPFFYERDWEDEMEQRRQRSAKKMDAVLEDPMTKFSSDALVNGWGNECAGGRSPGCSPYMRAGLLEA